MQKLIVILRSCFSDGIPRRSVAVAAVVGTLLNLINQGDAMLDGGPLNFAKMALTYLVPYGVATYGAVSFRLAERRRGRAAVRPGWLGD